MIVIAQADDTVDAICWRYFGQTVNLVEKVYELNYRLSRQGPFLKAGTRIKLPTDIESAAIKKGFDLWD
ncbi:hypothetical protein AAEX37_01024 [Oligella sp. MSHR50489EDL]|uniref:tail protein X n=1 Tax=Oligella sp. MSHR50489EDL TaxID=3139409 RepID=UPI003D816DC2